VGGEFDPEAFNLEEVNARLRSMGRGRSTEILNAWSLEEDELKEKKFDLDSPWKQTLTEEQQLVAEDLPLRRDVNAMLLYLRDNKVTGTQATGNFPLNAVREICARFVDPPKLDDPIGERIFRVRSEVEVWPLYFRHVLASVGGLITGGLSRRWKLTPLGERFLAAPAPVQVWLLLATWWTQTNWAIASPYNFEGGYMPADFSRLVLKHLLGLPLGEPVSFEQFADPLIADSRMYWPIQDTDSAQRILRKIIERTVIDPLLDFEILKAEYEPHEMFGADFPQLFSFLVTPFGKGLLGAIHAATKPVQP
jgi:hypothetical protein